MCKTTTEEQDNALKRLQRALQEGAFEELSDKGLAADIALLVQGLNALKSGNTATSCAGKPIRLEPVVRRRMKPPAAEGPFAGDVIAQRMMKICGCAGTYNCDCVTVKNMALRELWTEHNANARKPD